MANSYKITIKNKTGAPQDYSFFSAPPLVSGGMSGDIWSNVIKAAPKTANGANAQLTVWANYYAICGSTDGTPDQGVSISISKAVKIALGSGTASSPSMGSTIALSAENGASIDLGPPTTPGKGKIGCFQLTTTGSKFTVEQAKNNNLVIGIANSPDGDITNAMGTFTPYPASLYQIQPQMIYYVATGERFQAGQLVKVERLGSSMAVDFNARQTNNVTLIHNDDMTFDFA